MKYALLLLALAACAPKEPWPELVPIAEILGETPPEQDLGATDLSARAAALEAKAAEMRAP